jgi:hypothetical protein
MPYDPDYAPQNGRSIEDIYRTRQILEMQQAKIQWEKNQKVNEKAKENKQALALTGEPVTDVNPRKKYQLIIARERKPRWLSNREMLNLLEDPGQWGIKRFLTASEASDGLGDPQFWQRGDAFLQEIKAITPQPKEKSWTI